MRVQPDSIVAGFDRSYYLLTNPDVAAAGVDPLEHFNAFGWNEGRKPNALFDTAYYLTQNPDVDTAGVNPFEHYLIFGANEGRDPSAAFDTSAYLAANPDVETAGVNPLQHFLEFGVYEGRTIAGSLMAGSAGNDFLIGTSAADTLSAGNGNDFVIGIGGNDVADGGYGNDTVRFFYNFTDYTFTFNGSQVIVNGPEGQDTYTNFERFAFRDATIEREDSQPLVDDLYYYAQNPDVWAAGVDAALHYALFGWHEGRNPNQYFDTSYYLSSNPDVDDAGVNPLQHYLEFGASEGRKPSAGFDGSAYLIANPDVAAAGVNPLVHFLAYGQFEGRSPLGDVQPDDTTVTSPEDVEHVFGTGDFDLAGLPSVESVTIDAAGVADGTLYLDLGDDGFDPGDALTGTGNVVSISDIEAGRLRFRADADENGNDYASFSYTATSGSGTSDAATVTIDVTAVDDAPNDLTFTQAGPLPEGSLGGTVVGTVAGFDPDAGSTLTYSLVNENGSPYTGLFTINPTTGEITVASNADGDSIDFEATETGTLELIVRVTDQTELFSDRIITIDIEDVAEFSAQAIEGYIANATVFADANDNGELDDGEYSVITDSVGGFKIVGDHGDAPIILLGGGSAVDTATGLPFNGVLRAPPGSTVLSPITTLIAALVEAGESVEDATQLVVDALDLPDVDYTTFDPVAASLSGNTDGDAVFAAGVQVYNTIVQTASLLTGANPGASTTAADAVVDALVQQIQGAVTPISLANSTVLTDVITAAAATTSTDVSATASGAANVISGSNAIIQTAVNDAGTTGTALLQAVTGAAVVAQGDAAAALQQAGADGNTTDAENDYTSTNLQNAVDTATSNVDVNAVAGPNGDNTLIGTANADILDGMGGNDTIYAGGGKDILIGGSGDDFLDGDTLDGNQANRFFAFDRASYRDALEGITVNLAAGIVTGGASVGTDTLSGIEGIDGTNHDDVYDATGFSASSTNNGGVGYVMAGGNGAMGSFNQFEGNGGNDTITGNGNTRISYQNATAGVTVNLQTGTATGDVSVGTDTINGGVVQVRGSSHADTLIGTTNNPDGVETFEGRGGDDFIDGNGGFDRVRYDFENTGALGIFVNLGAGIVTGRDAAATAVVGTDTLRSIESIRGTQSADIFDASTFTATSTNGGGINDQGNFNEFEGMGGNDTIIGNGNTRVTYVNATSGVTITFTAPGVGTAVGDASVGIDTFVSGVALARGSNFNDTIIGFNNGLNNFETFEGWAGDDFIDGGLGNDRARYDGNNGDQNGMPLILGMIFNMAAGTAVGRDGNATFNYGTDTLRGIEAIRGTNADDIYDATGFSASSVNAGGNGNFNEFEGGGGNDTITGNGSTRVGYANAGGAVTVDLQAGSATGVGIGTDNITGGVNAVRGSNFDDNLLGSNNAPGTTELFEGMGGNDTINGRGGNDLVRYDNNNTGASGILITRDAVSSTVTGLDGAATAVVGTDTLINIEGVRGTNQADTYNATGFAGFNEFEGMGGNDTITGSGNTRVSYQNASGSVTVDLAAGTAIGAAGSDTITGGVNAVRGSQFADVITGSAGNNTFIGGGGSDTFVFHAGFGADTISDFVAGAGTDDVIQFDQALFADFNAVFAASQQSGSNVVITLDASNTITLTNVALANLHANDFVFV